MLLIKVLLETHTRLAIPHLTAHPDPWGECELQLFLCGLAWFSLAVLQRGSWPHWAEGSPRTLKAQSVSKWWGWLQEIRIIHGALSYQVVCPEAVA